MYNLFSKLEEDGVLNIDNVKHVAVLHKVFLPRINNSLDTFRKAWNNHPISTERNYTPLQLSVLHLPPEDRDLYMPMVIFSVLRNTYSLTLIFTLFLYQDDLQNADIICNNLSDTALLSSSDDGAITDPDSLSGCLTAVEERRLQLIDVLRDSNTFGYDLYLEAISCLDENQ